VTGRQLARLADVPPTTAQRVLDDLVDAGIASAERLGAAVGYRLNSRHVVAQAVLDLARARLTLLDEIKGAIGSWTVQPVAGWLYGSTARADGDRHSDIDLLLVAPDDLDEEVWSRQIGELAELVVALTGNHAEIIEHTRASLMELERAGSSFLANLRAEGFDLFDSGWARLR
jgi:predicted nucleotidyltransferase